MNKIFKSVSLAVVFSSSLLATGIASATYIETSASGTGVPGTGDDAFTDVGYSYNFEINDSADSLATTFSAILTNTSLNPDAQIDLLAFNMFPELTLGTDFTIENIAPYWTFTVGSGGVLFDYTGDADSPDDKLAKGESLTFDFLFIDNQSFTLWTTSDESLGKGIGGGEDLGQVAVSFQTLGPLGKDSDLLASNWSDVIDPPDVITPVPEPSSLLLLGLGLAALRLRKYLN